MKQMKDEAVSPVIAVILMVAITVVLAATVFVLVADIGQNQNEIAPMANIGATTDSGATKAVIIKHVTGQQFKANEWKVSITVGENSAPLYAVPCSASLDAGDQLRSLIVTQPDTTCTDSTTTDASPGSVVAAGKYHVVVVHVPSSTTMLDTNVEVL